MMLRRFARGFFPASAFALLLLVPSPATRAADPVKAEVSKWDIIRTTVPESIEELKALQATVKRVVDRSTACTVGVMIGMGAGSGVIVSEDGLVLTAAHVSGEPGKDCTLILPDGTRIKGKTLGTNDKLDSGMIQITDKGPNKDGKWPFIPMGKSIDLKKGQWLVALGHPGGWKRDRPPVARLGQVMDSSKDVVRSSCTLVGGDSGGPLFDLEGNVVGIHSRIGYTLASNMHVPSDAFKTEWEKLVKGEQIGKPTKPAAAIIGVTFDDKSDAALLVEITEDGPAAKAGLRAGDIINEFDGKKVASADDIRTLLRKKKPNDEVEIVIKRGAKTMSMTLTLGKRDS